jgi:shikimate kinase
MHGYHLILVGLPGAGKTSVGRLAAGELRAEFVDFDEELERRTGMSPSRIFEAHGEPYFRKLERELTAEMRGRTPAILAPGGGWMAEAGNVALIRPPSRIIHLRVGVRAALARLGARAGDRPLLRGDDPQALMTLLWTSRARAYAQADGEIDTEQFAIEEVTQMVGELASAWRWPN